MNKNILAGVHLSHLQNTKLGMSSGSTAGIPWSAWLLHRECLHVSRAGFMARCLARDLVTHRAYDLSSVLN